MEWAPKSTTFGAAQNAWNGGTNSQELGFGISSGRSLEAAVALIKKHELPRVYKSSRPNFAGLLEGIRAYHFDATIRIPKSAGGMEEDLPRHDSVFAPDVTALDAETT